MIPSMPYTPFRVPHHTRTTTYCRAQRPYVRPPLPVVSPPTRGVWTPIWAKHSRPRGQGNRNLNAVNSIVTRPLSSHPVPAICNPALGIRWQLPSQDPLSNEGIPSARLPSVELSPASPSPVTTSSSSSSGDGSSGDLSSSDGGAEGQGRKSVGNGGSGALSYAYCLISEVLHRELFNVQLGLPRAEGTGQPR